MLGRTEELTALFETLGVLSCALMACLSRGWRTAMKEARAQMTSVEVLDFIWPIDQQSHWAKRHHKRIEYFRDNFAMMVLPRFYTGLRKLRLGGLRDRTASRPFLEVDHRFPAVDEALAHVTSRCTQLRELDVDHAMSNVSLTIVASNCPNLQKLGCLGSGISDVGLAALAQGCKQLEHLQIRGEFTHEGVVAIARGCRLLKTLYLASLSTIEDPALVALGQHCPLLRSFSGGRGWNRITDAALTALAHGCPQLEEVELPHAALITDASANALAQGCPNLDTINLYGTGVTAAGVLTLAKHAKQKLRIRAPGMSASEARALEKEYPVEVNQLNIKVVTHDGIEIYFKMRNTVPLKALMNAVCKRQCVSLSKLRFLFEGNRIHETQTPAQLDMEDGDVIDVYLPYC